MMGEELRKKEEDGALPEMGAGLGLSFGLHAVDRPRVLLHQH